MPGQEGSRVTENAHWDISGGVGQTALAVAACRAVETRRESPLVRDPYAEAFVRAAQSPVPLPTTPEAADSDPVFPWASFATYVGVRSRFFDEFCASALGGPAATGLRQVVLLAAGLDTRAFRLDWPGDVTLYEVDAPLVLGFKDLVLASSDGRPRGARCTVAADLREDWPPALRAAGFNPAQPTAWLAEGLLPYLTDEEKARLLATVHDLSAPGSEIAVEHLSAGVESLRAYAVFQEASEHHDVEFDAAALWTGGQHADPVPWLASRDWSVTISPITTTAEQYGRPLSATLPESMLATVLIQARLEALRGPGRQID
jgi:methyltransferase (TIGR00027 family)